MLPRFGLDSVSAATLAYLANPFSEANFCQAVKLALRAFPALMARGIKQALEEKRCTHPTL